MPISDNKDRAEWPYDANDYRLIRDLHLHGKTVSQIVDELNMPEDKVRFYITNWMRKS